MTWKARIIDSFKNQRKRKLRDVPEVAERIDKRRRNMATLAQDQSDDGSAPVQRCPNPWGLVNFLPQRSPGEDDTSIKAAKQYLVKEGRLSRCDQVKIDFFMDRTFADRRRAIIREGATVKTILDQYPDLGSEEGVSSTIFRKKVILYIRNLHQFSSPCY